MPLTLYKTCACQIFTLLHLFTCLVYVSTYCVPIAHLRQSKPFPLLYLGHAQIIIIIIIKKKEIKERACLNIISNKLCGSRKYPYHPHGRDRIFQGGGRGGNLPNFLVGKGECTIRKYFQRVLVTRKRASNKEKNKKLPQQFICEDIKHDES